MKDVGELRLQRLRIPGGWEMIINNFLEVDVTQYEEDDRIWLGITQDLMYIKRITDAKEESIGLDLGWYPDGDPKGEFSLRVIKNDDFQNPIEEFCSRDKNEIVDKIEEYLEKLSD